MPNPFNVPPPAGVRPDWWAEAEAFANGWYEIPCDQIFYGNLVARAYAQSCSAEDTPLKKWIWLATFRLNQLIEGDDSRIRDWVSAVFSFFGINIPDGSDDVGGGGGYGGIGSNSGALDDLLDLTRDLLGNIDGATRAATNAVANTSTAAQFALVDTANSAVNRTADLAATILNAIDGNNRSAASSITDLFNRSNNSLIDLLRNGTDLFERLTGVAIGSIEDLLADTLSKQDGILGKIGDVLSASLLASQENDRAVSSAVTRALEAEVRQAEENSRAITEGLSESIERITGESESALSTTRDVLAGTGREQAEATRQSGAAVAGAVEQSGQAVSGSIDKLTHGSEGLSAETMRDRINAAFDAVARQGNCPADFSAFVHDFIDKITSEWNPLTPLIHILGEVQLIQNIFGPALQVLGNCLAQAAARAAPTALPDPSEIREQLRRRIIGIEEANDLMAQQGYNIDRAANILATRREIPNEGFIQTWFLRGFISADDAIRALADRGYQGEDIENLLKMAFFIPPPQDLITMAVREVFSPAVAARFGQFEDFPEAFSRYAGQQGISEEWAQRYWAAHWSLPSPQQGFEMFHRDVIEFDDLQLLLKSLDIMPFWRDKLTQIAYRPVTRVDIRRMHKLGMLNHAETVTRYRHMGFSPADAEFMTQFTEQLNKSTGAETPEDLEGATRGTISQLFRRGAITEAQARQLLTELGLGDRAVNVIITNDKMALELERREQETRLIIEQAKAGLISFDNAQDALARLGLEPTELRLALTSLRRAEAQQTKLPTRADADKFYKQGLMSDPEYILLLTRLGYSLQWSTTYLQSVKLAKESE